MFKLLKAWSLAYGGSVVVVLIATAIVVLLGCLVVFVPLGLVSRDDVGLLDDSEEIARGGGYPLMAITGQQHVLMPRKVVLWKPLRARESAQRTHKAAVEHLNGLLASGA
jgi:hypothetical protein